jgi:hemerythrin-like domain-containing protein
MPNPINSLTFVHTAIRTEASAIEALATSDGPDLEALRERLTLIERVMRAHFGGEELGLFPPLAEKFPHIDDAFLYDHQEEDKLFHSLHEAMDGALSEDAASMAALARGCTALCLSVTHHSTKEDELILPLVAEQFSPAEQGEMVGKILSTITPEDMVDFTPWIVDNQPPSSAEAYVRALMGAMPAPVFAAAKGWIEDGISAEKWQDLKARIPEL